MEIKKLNNELRENMLQNGYKDKAPVFGLGPVNARIALIGEAPGADEEKQGMPFVGKAGKNLTELLDTIGIKRDEVYITNTVKIRPTKISPKTGNNLNRAPNSNEIAFFRPFLLKELEIIAPEYIVTLGNVALNAVSAKKVSIGDCHGSLTDTGLYTNVFALYHPAAIIYNQSLKETYLEDMNRLSKILKSEC